MADLNRQARLDDRYDVEQAHIFVGGMQTIVRLLVEQSERDRRAGLTTGGFVSGYRGSPVGTLDAELWKARRQLDYRSIHFQPGVNEELAATAVWGSQQLALTGGSDLDGVFGLWYGKGPGVDRSGDAFKHANLAGTSPFGGVLVLAGDDPQAKSSTTAHQSEQALAAAFIPVLVPSDLQEVLDFGLIGFAMSRYSGCWISLKVTTSVADASSTIASSLGRLQITSPPPPQGDLHIRWPDAWVAAEARLTGPKLAAARSFAAANPVDKLIWDSPGARVGIVTSGRSHHDVVEALRRRGINADNAAAHGVRLYKVGMPWPLEPTHAAAFAQGLERILVVEEKRSLIEAQLKDLLYGHESRPAIIGKRDADGGVLVKEFGEITPEDAAAALDGLLGPAAFGADAAALLAAPLPPELTRTEFFCAGCPHNRSTKVPESSIALAGIGCHSMAARSPERKTVTICQMGGEGATWIGQAPFSKRNHVFQNLGDGTYFHSGFLAVRAAIAAKVNITYKLLLNDAVAMTGGQPVDGTLSVEAICTELLAEGAAKIVVVTDDPDAPRALPAGVEVHDRRQLDMVQQALREVPGVTVLVYQQVCAAEKRRRRKRGKMPDLTRRLYINQAVCEGCGDCVKQSSCIAVAPVQTPFGRKRQIDQSSCNKDFSCLEGFCPSFVELEGATLHKVESRALHNWLSRTAEPPVTQRSAGDPFRVLITGIGGTGVVTIGAVLAMAAHLDGNNAQALDQTGLAQKNGAVSSHVTIGAKSAALGPVKIGEGCTDLLIACDAVVAAASEMMMLLPTSGGWAVINEAEVPTVGDAFALKGPARGRQLIDRLVQRMGDAGVETIDASRLARLLLGDGVFANIMMLGYAWQISDMPVSLENLRAAIRLNGAAVDDNIAAFELGRHLGNGGEAAIAGLAEPGRPVARQDEPVADIVQRQTEYLRAFQDNAYAERYRVRMERLMQAERAAGLEGTPLSRLVAFSLARVMSYKDEYEVARLYSNGAFMAALTAQFGTIGKVKVHLSPPILSRIDPSTGRPRKRAFGSWVLKAMSLLARGKRLRGSVFDPFALTTERKAERALVAHYEALVEEVGAGLTPERMVEAQALLTAVDDVRGFGPVKGQNLAAYHAWIGPAMDSWRSGAAMAAAAKVTTDA